MEKMASRPFFRNLFQCLFLGIIIFAFTVAVQHHGNTFISGVLKPLSIESVETFFYTSILTLMIHGAQNFILAMGWLWLSYRIGRCAPSAAPLISVVVPPLGIALTWSLLPRFNPNLSYFSPIHIMILLLMILLIQLLLLEVENWLDRTFVLLLWVFSFQSLELLPSFSAFSQQGPFAPHVQEYSLISMAGLALFFSFITGAVSSTWLLGRYSVWLKLLRQSWGESSFRHQGEDDQLKGISMIDLRSLAHDFKNPLSVIKGIASMQRDETNSEESKLMLRAVEYMEQMILEMLQEEERSPVNVGAFFDTLEQHLRPFPWGEEVTLSLDPDAKEQGISANEIRLTRAFLNIIDNAWRANRTTETHGISLTARHSSNFLEVEITDNCPGYTDSSARPGRSKWGSTGWGLAFARRIVGLHNGTLLILPRADRKHGTTVLITLPLLPRSS
ncbi:MAG: HAMP domain-containing histidine kinase [Fretibacterium sp.]|nr:HAMP domain-containing histidine kinase [Fretibacterium sp.]